MSNIDKQAFRPDGGDIGSGRIREIADNPYGDEEKCWLAKRVLALLDENNNLLREKDAMESADLAMRDEMRDAREKLEAAEKRIAELEAMQGKPVMFIDGDISSSDADKLAAVIREFNEETETPAARMARIIRENPHPTNMCDMPTAGTGKGE